jgi:hypothetical protein
MLQPDSILTLQALDCNSDFLVHFGTRKFRHKIFFPTLFLRFLPSLTDSFVSLISQTKSIPEVISNLAQLKATAAGDTRFGSSVDDLITNLKHSSDLPKFTWEVASDLVTFYREVIDFYESSLILLGRSDEIIQSEVAKINTVYVPAVQSRKPRNTDHAIVVPLQLSHLKVMKSYSQFAQSQAGVLPKCVECDGPATWFAFPCSHGVYCDEDHELNEDSLATQCPLESCHKPIEKLVHIPLPE